MLKLRTLLIASLFSVHLTNVEASGPCGNEYCRDGEVCKTSVNGGTCILKQSKVRCYNSFYCYTPSTCCGYGNCCPKNTYCDGTRCRTDSFRLAIKGWYGGLFIFTLTWVIPCLIRCRTHMDIASRRRAVTTAPAQSRREQYGYDQGPIVLGIPETIVANIVPPSDANDPLLSCSEGVQQQAQDM